ncbi:MAG: SMI1/KNR4 family protein [Bacteroidia bacterium]
MIDYLRKVIQEAKSENITLVPCSKEEVDKVKEYAGEKLPAAYIEYLETMGRGTPDGFLRGHSCFINKIFDLKNWAEDLLVENEFSEKLRKEDFVFWMSQGYVFAFFKLNEGEDPPIYYYREGSGQKKFIRIHFHLSGFLLGFIRGYPDLFEEK